MDEQELSIIEDRVNSTTKGIWKSYVEGRDHTCGDDFILAWEGVNIYINGWTLADQDFIANAKQDIPKLLKEIRKLQSLKR